MRTISTALKTHLQQPTTTVCYLLKIEPKNGVAPVFGLTTLDTDVVYNDGSGSLTYRAKRGYTAFDVETSNDLSVDNSEARGLLAEYPADGVTAEGIAQGLYDSARFLQYLVNYNDLTMGHCIINSGQVGQVKNLDDMLMSMEMRSLTQILKQQAMIEVTSITCRADYGDGRCKQGFTWYDATVTSVGAENDREFSVNSFVQTQNDTQFGAGDGSTKIFQLVDQGGNPVTGNFTLISISGTTATYTVSATGVVTFATAPTAWARLGWTGTVSKSPAGTGAGAITFVPFFTADGVASTAQLRDTTGAPVTSGFTITTLYLNGVATTHYTVSGTGLVTFTDGAPASGVVARWDGTIPLTPDGEFAPGVVEWVTGNNAGRQSDVESFVGATNTFELLIPVYLPVQVGDALKVRTDCDKSWTMCKDRYANELNFRGEKDSPRADSSDLQAPSNIA